MEHLELSLCNSTRFVTKHTHTHLTALFPGLPGWGGTREVKPIWILLKQETVSGSGVSWAICKSAPRSRQITMPAPHHSVFYRPDALSAAQPTASKHWRHFVTKLPLELVVKDRSCSQGKMLLAWQALERASRQISAAVVTFWSSSWRRWNSIVRCWSVHQWAAALHCRLSFVPKLQRAPSVCEDLCRSHQSEHRNSRLLIIAAVR